MKIRYLILAAVGILSATRAAAQQNPYKSIGKKGKVLTLSKGKYDEFFDYKDVQRIGSVMYNIRTKKIVKLLNADSLYKKASDNSSASRWYSIDPLAEKYACLSPYAAMGNNPILFVDKDGREITPGTGWAGSAYQSTYNKLYSQASFKQLTQRFEGNKDRNVMLNLYATDPTGQHSLGRTNSSSTNVLSGGRGEFFLAGNHDMSFFSAESQFWNKSDLNSLGQAAVITHEFLHANSYYTIDNNQIRFDFGGEASLAYGGYLEKMQGVLTDFVKTNNISGVSELDIKAISALGIGIQDNQLDIIQPVADIVGQYAKEKLGITLDANDKKYGEKLAAAYTVMRDDVSARLLTEKKDNK